MQIKKIGKMLKSEAKTENEGSTQQVSSMCVKRNRVTVSGQTHFFRNGKEGKQRKIMYWNVK